MIDGDTVHLDLNKLKVISPLGRGANGVVFLVQTENYELLALKAVLRSSIEKKNKEDCKSISIEREMLNCFQHPLLPRLHGVVVTDKIVGYAIDYCPGRDLDSLRKNQSEKMFSDDIIRFYAAELVLALEYLHSLGIVYRDLKPDNVMIQENGHLMLVDFDLSIKLSPRSPETDTISSSSTSAENTNAPQQEKEKMKKKKKILNFFKRRDSRVISKEDSVSRVESVRHSVSSESDSVQKSNSFVGTEEYVAPEIIQGDGHDFSVDWWSLGIMLYEMLYGTTPFKGENRRETFQRIITKVPNLTGEQTPLRDLIGKLLEKDPGKRISVREIKSHCYFKDVNWRKITEMPRPPFIPAPTVVDGIEGNGEFDVESYVQAVFAADEVEDNGKSVNKRNCEENRKIDVWVNKNHPTHIQNDNFFIF